MVAKYRSSHLKILTPDHKLEAPEGIDCPRFGEIGKLEIFTQTRRFLSASNSSEKSVFFPAEEDPDVEVDIEKSIRDEQVIYELEVLQKALAKQTKFQWATALLLLVLVFVVS